MDEVTQRTTFMRYILILLLTLNGYGCAAKKMAVENADYLISRQVYKKIPLYSDQKSQFSKDIDIFLNQVKPNAQNILPVIDEMDLEASDKMTSQYEKLEEFFKKLSKKFSDLISTYLAKLDVKQQKDFFKNLDDENREILKLEKEKNIDQVENRVKLLLGSINSDQKQLIRENSQYFEQRAKERLDRRVELHQIFRSIYAQDISENSRIKLFQEAFGDYQTKSTVNTKNLELLQKLLPTITKKQREHFRKEAQEVKDLLKYFITIEY
jgi:hypothetical protein